MRGGNHVRARTVQGSWETAFTPLIDAFTALVASGKERGSIAVVIDGRSVVDVWGGLADPATGRPWARDTLACCFSVSKGVLSLLAHRLVDLSLLDLEWPVARLWPEFAPEWQGVDHCGRCV